MSVKESGEMYLETILRLQKELSAVHSVDIAKALNAGRKVHFLPPYRNFNKILLNSLLNKPHLSLG